MEKREERKVTNAEFSLGYPLHSGRHTRRGSNLEYRFLIGCATDHRRGAGLNLEYVITGGGGAYGCCHSNVPVMWYSFIRFWMWIGRHERRSCVLESMESQERALYPSSTYLRGDRRDSEHTSWA